MRGQEDPVLGRAPGGCESRGTAGRPSTQHGPMLTPAPWACEGGAASPHLEER